MAIVFASFQWSTKKGETPVFSSNSDFNYEPELIPVTRREEPKPIEIKPLVIPDKFQIIDNMDKGENANFQGSENIPDVPVNIVPVNMEPEPEVVEPPIFERVEHMPEFPGGDKALFSFIGKHIVFPEIAKESNIQGRVYIKFVIDDKGKVGNIQVLRGVDPILDQEAMRVVSLFPDWKPGRQGLKNVSVYYTLPINFRLN